MFESEILLLITCFFAYVCTILSTSLSIYFFKHRGQPLGKAVCVMLAGEAVGMAVVSIFATLEMLQTLEHFSPIAASFIRWAAIFATAFSSLHLAKQVRNILKNNNKD